MSFLVGCASLLPVAAVNSVQPLKVYWNSRLHHEHARIVGLLKKEDVVADMMAGIGPFALPAGKRGIKVYANDLNPNSYSSMVTNIKLNKVGAAVHGARFSAGICTRGAQLSCIPLLRLKPCHACDQFHSSRAFTPLPLFGTVISFQTLKGHSHTDRSPNPNPSHQFRPNTEGNPSICAAGSLFGS
jgi:hypothetical protein